MNLTKKRVLFLWVEEEVANMPLYGRSR